MAAKLPKRSTAAAGADLSLAEALPAPKRGRPSAQWFTAAEVATWLDVNTDVVARSLELDKFRKSLWPHAEPRGEAGVWMIAERDLVKLLGPGIPRPLWVSEFADFIGYSVAQVNVMIRGGEIPTVMIYGRRRVLETVIWQLPKAVPVKRARRCPEILRKPRAGRPASSFFPDEEAEAA